MCLTVLRECFLMLIPSSLWLTWYQSARPHVRGSRNIPFNPGVSRHTFPSLLQANPGSADHRNLGNEGIQMSRESSTFAFCVRGAASMRVCLCRIWPQENGGLSATLQCDHVFSLNPAPTDVLRYTGSCIQTNDQKYTRHYATVQCIQAFVVFLCCKQTPPFTRVDCRNNLLRLTVLYACWKSHKSPASRGRMSVRLSMDDMRIPISPLQDNVASQPRGWWDYVPRADPPDPQPEMKEQSSQRKPSFGDRLSELPTNFIPILGKGEQRGRYRPYPYNYTTARNRIHSTQSDDAPDNNSMEMLRPNGAQSPTLSKTSSMRKFQRLFGRQLFRQVMKDEVWSHDLSRCQNSSHWKFPAPLHYLYHVHMRDNRPSRRDRPEPEDIPQRRGMDQHQLYVAFQCGLQAFADKLQGLSCLFSPSIALGASSSGTNGKRGSSGPPHNPSG